MLGRLNERLASFLMVLVLLQGLAPMEYIHMLFEQHDHEVHVCDYDHCVREFVHHCDLDSWEAPVKSFPHSESLTLNLTSADNQIVPHSPDLVFSERLAFQQRGPPNSRFFLI